MTPQQRAQQAAAAAAEKQAQQNAQRVAAAAAQRQAQANAIRQASANRGSATVPSAGLLDPTGGANALKGAPVGAAVPEEPAAPVRKPFSFVPDSGYNDAVGLNKKRYDDAITGLNKAETSTKFDFGFDDPTNPFSRVTEQKRLYLAKNKGDATSLNSRGMLLSGANLRNIDRNKRSEDKDYAALKSAYETALDAIRRARGTAGTDQEEANLRAWRESHDRQLAEYNAS